VLTFGWLRSCPVRSGILPFFIPPNLEACVSPLVYRYHIFHVPRDSPFLPCLESKTYVGVGRDKEDSLRFPVDERFTNCIWILRSGRWGQRACSLQRYSVIFFFVWGCNESFVCFEDVLRYDWFCSKRYERDDSLKRSDNVQFCTGTMVCPIYFICMFSTFLIFLVILGLSHKDQSWPRLVPTFQSQHNIAPVTSKTGPVTTAAMFDKNEWRRIVVIRPWRPYTVP
jgi:hypothetical protein